MREIRPSGSEGGGGHKASPYPYTVLTGGFAATSVYFALRYQWTTEN